MRAAGPVLRVGALDIAYREWGTGQPVLLLNGTGESGRTFAGLASALAGRWRCVAPDNRDCGGSSRAPETYTPREMAGDAAGVIEGLGLGPCHVVGFSLGGAAAQELAATRPELVRSVVLLSTWPASDGWFVAQMRQWQALRRGFGDDETGFLRALEPWLLSPATYADPALLGAIEGLWDGDAGQEVDAFCRQCDADIAHDASPRLPGVRLPALVLVGTDDVCTPPRFSRALAELLPDAALVEIPDAGHCALFERPEAVAGAVGGFFARIERARDAGA